MINGWNKELQMCELKHGDIHILSKSNIEVLGPPELVALIEARERAEAKAEAEERAEWENRSKRSSQYTNIQTIIKGGDSNKWNNGLGVAQKDVKETLKKIEDTTGQRLQEVGNDKQTVASKPAPFQVDRNMVDHIKNTVD